MTEQTTTPVSPQRVLADEMPGDVQRRWDIAADQLRALAEHGYQVVSVLEPDQPPDPELVVLVGAAGSGKTTWAGQQPWPPGTVVSSDGIRGWLTGDPGSQDVNPQTWEWLYRIVKDRLTRRLTTVVDSTGRPVARRQLLALAAAAGVPVRMVVFDTPLQVCQERNRSRARVVPEDALVRQWEETRLALAQWRESGSVDDVQAIPYVPDQRNTDAGVLLSSEAGQAGD